MEQTENQMQEDESLPGEYDGEKWAKGGESTWKKMITMFYYEI